MIIPKANTFESTFAQHANFVSMIMSNSDSYGWLLNNFIQIVTYDDLYIDYYDFAYRNSPVINMQRVNKEYFADRKITDIIKQVIDSKNCMYMVVNTKYITSYAHEVEKML